MKSTRKKAGPPTGAGLLAIGAAVVVSASFLPVANAGMVYAADEAATTEVAQSGVVTQAVLPQQVVVGQPVVQQPVAQPVYQQPVVQAQPVYQQPVVQAQPVYQQPVVQAQPVYQQPVVQAQPVYQQPVPQVQVGPATTYEPAPQVEAVSVRKSETMRRQRESAERNNEDLLQERLEQLRLRDEQRRLDQLFQGAQGPSGDMGSAPLAQQTVVTPVTERPGQAAQPVVTVASTAAMDVAEEDQAALISIQTRAGFSEMTGNVGYTVRPRISGGIGLGVATSDNVSFELGYTYTEYGVALASSNPYIQWAQGGYNYNPSTESQAMKQNVFEVGMKLHFLGPSARLRPFIGGGGAYSLSFINYDANALGRLKNIPGMEGVASDYELSSYLGYVSTGVDLRVNKSVSVGVVGKYYNVLSSRERSSLNNAALYGMYPGYGYGYNSASYASMADAEKQFVAGSLAKISFYSIMAGATFSF
ncbi:MAG: hypothetical protein NDJ90_00850 [Oligoflexia bacterium]|nr:hypothetical protein [Oligoflexia bacterium]